MLYQYRWWHAAGLLLILVVIGYGYDFYPLQNQIYELKQSEIHLQEKLINTPLFPAKMSAENIKISGENTLVNAIHVSGLTIQTIHLLPNDQSENIVMHVDMRGSYQQWIALMNALEQKKQLISVQNFSCKSTEKNNLQIGIDVLLMQNAQVISYQQEVKSQNNPFCTRDNVDQWLNQSVDEVLLSPITQIKMVGYLQLGTHSQALMLLPNNVMRTIEMGSLLGVERGVVVAIYREHVVVRMRDGKKVMVGA